MEIRHLRYFIAVAELRNFTKAAGASFVAQSALSQQISRLEHELGAPLFVRGKRGAELTPAGELLLPHARRIVADEAWARAEMRSYLGLEKGRLTIGMIQTSASGVDVAGAVAEFSQRYPGIELHIVDQTTAEMVEGVRRGPLDLAVIGIGPDELPDGLESRQLAVEPLVGVVSEKLADGLVGPVSIADLLGRGRLIQFAAGTGIRRHVDAALGRAGLEASSPLELNQASDLVVFAALGLGVTIVPRTLAVTSAPQLAEAGRRCVVLGLTDPLAVHPVTVVFAPSRLSASAQEFFDLLVRAANNKKKRSLSADTCVGPIEVLIPDLSVQAAAASPAALRHRDWEERCTSDCWRIRTWHNRIPDQRSARCCRGGSGKRPPAAAGGRCPSCC
jgi:DNA-binding transcriptional LysR family regulator